MEERGIRFVRLWFTDVLGSLKSVAIAPAEVEGAISEGVGFDGSAIEGFARVFESDMVAHPDPSTYQVLPWRQAGRSTARMLCDIKLPDGSPSFADPRYVLKRALQKAGQMGFTFYIHPEIEFFLLRSLTPPVPLDDGGYFDHTTLGDGTDFRRDAITMLEQMGISVEFSHHEAAPGQHEIDLRYADALTMADNVMTFRVVIREVAVSQGIHASFMPKPFSEHPGSGMHTHMSLFEGDTNAFYDASDEYNLSKTAKQFIAGLMRHAPEITAVTNQWVNSYKRLVGGGEAPSYACWGRANRSALIRIPQFTPGKTSSARIEYRAVDAAVNPYLAYAVLLNAGLKGIEEEYELPEETEDEVWRLTDRERQAIGIRELPHNLDEALRLMEESELVAETLGEHVFEYFLRNKHEEFSAYRKQVTPWELERHIRVM
ncbi:MULTISPECIES: glutamine synthetase family protein [unclassified Tessaracoccus]|uniref:glutamine synthetase family protein n=1 Tax=unclassified Tessaracoccus TaxID=2635419 RepID=UPI0015FF1D74|nr:MULTISPECIES: glutamine synthetase family protein [unclassified Tessaracoccus]MBB1512503.1 glutamine synthetase [Tessaracoccus sp. MC1627]MBB1516597.1 glutamine synthetase [Tessaracoccus sp. MC1679]